MALADLLADPDADWVYIVVVTLQSGIVGWSFGRIASPRFGETTRQFPPFVRNPLNVQMQIAPMEIGSGGATTIGTIDIAWEPDEGLDSLVDEIWDGNPITVYLGLPSYDFADFYPLFSGYTEDAIFDAARLSIVVRTPGWQLDEPLQPTLYLGTGTTNTPSALYEGGAALKNAPKPIALGAPRNVTPVKIDDESGTQWRIYQFHDGVAAAVDMVYDGGVALTSAGDTTNLFAWTPVGGNFKTDLSRGLFRLGSVPTGLVTADVQGVNDDADVTFPTTAAELVRWIAKHAGYVDADLDTTSFDDLDTAASFSMSFYASGGGVSSVQVIREILASVGGYSYFSLLGKLTVGQFALGTSGLTLDHARGQGLLHSLRRVRSPLPIWRFRFGAARNWTVQADDASLGGTDAHKATVTKPYTIAKYSGAGRLATHPFARDIEDETLYDGVLAAGFEGLRRYNLFDGTHFLYEIETSGIQYLLKLGQTITVKYPRFGFEAGKDVAVVAINENAASRRTTLLVYG